jgi:hypothetical protein
MLREGWDVKNVTVVVGLRPYTAKHPARTGYRARLAQDSSEFQANYLQHSTSTQEISDYLT